MAIPGRAPLGDKGKAIASDSDSGSDSESAEFMDSSEGLLVVEVYPLGLPFGGCLWQVACGCWEGGGVSLWRRFVHLSLAGGAPDLDLAG